MKERLRQVLSEKRYNHSIGVCNEAVKLAKIYGVDTDKAYTAGLLHDCAKGYDVAKQIELCDKYGLKLDDVTLACPPVIHGPLGAVIAKKEYGVCDEEILEAIRYHTVAKENMSALDKIVYVADMIEPLRNYPHVDELRRVAYENIDKAFIMGMKQSIMHNADENKIIHLNTILAWNYMLRDTKID